MAQYTTPLYPSQPCEISGKSHLHCCGHLGFREELHQDVTQCCHSCNVELVAMFSVVSWLLTPVGPGGRQHRETRAAPTRYSAVRHTGSLRHFRLETGDHRLEGGGTQDHRQDSSHLLSQLFRSHVKILMLGSSARESVLCYYFLTKEVQQ